MKELEEGLEIQLDWGKLRKVAANAGDVVPVAVQHARGQRLSVKFARGLSWQQRLRVRASACSNGSGLKSACF